MQTLHREAPRHPGAGVGVGLRDGVAAAEADRRAPRLHGGVAPLRRPGAAARLLALAAALALPHQDARQVNLNLFY